MKESMKVFIEDYAMYFFGVALIGSWYYNYITGLTGQIAAVAGLLMILASFYMDYRFGEELQKEGG